MHACMWYDVWYDVCGMTCVVWRVWYDSVVCGHAGKKPSAVVRDTHSAASVIIRPL